MQTGDILWIGCNKGENGCDKLNIELTLLSGAAYHLEGLSYTDTIKSIKKKGRSLMMQANVLLPYEYEVQLIFDGGLLQDNWMLSEAGLRSGDSVQMVCEDPLVDDEDEAPSLASSSDSSLEFCRVDDSSDSTSDVS